MSFGIALNRNVAEMEYAVRGPIPQRAAELARQGKTTIPCHIGNPQALGQQPITFYRQILSLLETPALIGRERKLRQLFAKAPQSFAGLTDGDLISEYALDLCDHVLSQMPTGTGAYTESKGPRFIREAIAQYIERRDNIATTGGVPSDPENIFLTNGASESVKHIIDMLVAGPSDGIMIPIPQYPLYSAAIKKSGGVQVNYYPDEDNGWTLSRSVLDEAFSAARKNGVNVKGIVVINPANPTGAILSEQSVRDLLGFAREHHLPVIADEVYQDNLYGARFVSFASQLDNDEVPLFSLHSTSKGFCGECGHRGGYVEVRNPPMVEGRSGTLLQVLLKLASVSLCSNTVGQVLTYLLVSQPEKGSPPYDRFLQEKEHVLNSLRDKAAMIRAAFEQMKGVECFGRTGAMYLFPRLNGLPAGSGDFEYCMNLLETTGLCTVNGSGFGQSEGTNHLRIAFLPPQDLLERVLPRWIEFHNGYVGAV